MSDSIENQAEMLPFVTAKQIAVTAFEREYLSRALTLANGSVTDAARMTGLDRANLRKLLIRNGLRTPGRNTRAGVETDDAWGKLKRLASEQPDLSLAEALRIAGAIEVVTREFAKKATPSKSPRRKARRR